MNRRGFLGSLCALMSVAFARPLRAIPRKTVPIGSDPTCQCTHCKIYRQFRAAHIDWKSDEWYADPDKTLRHGDSFTIVGDPTTYTAVDPFWTPNA